MTKLLIIFILVISAASVVFLIPKTQRSVSYSFGQLFRRFIRTSMLLTLAMTMVFGCILVCYADIAQVLKTVMSSESVNDIRAIARLITGFDSVFTAIEAAAFSSVMFSIVSCVALVFGEAVSYMPFFAASSEEKIQREEHEGGTVAIEYATVKPFLAFSKFNS